MGRVDGSAVFTGSWTWARPNRRFTQRRLHASVAGGGGRGARKLGLTPIGSVVFAVENASAKIVASQVVNLSSNANQASVAFTNLAVGSYTLVADACPQPNGVGVPFEQATFFFSITIDGSTVTQTFTLAGNSIAEIIITPPSPTVAVGGSAQLNATVFDASNEVVFIDSQSGALTWTSAGPTIATVDFTGKVTGVAPGTDLIEVAMATNASIGTNITITSSNEIVGFAITNSPVVYVGVGQSTNLGVVATNASGVKVPVAASALTWSSASVTNAVVDGAGLLIGVAPGLAEITVSLKLPAFSSTIIANVTNVTSPGNADGVPPPTNGYTITDLGALSPNISSLPTAINDLGHIAGITWESLSATNDTTAPAAFIWKASLNSQMTSLPDLGGGQAEATGINGSDQVVGWSIKPLSMSSTKQYMHAVLWQSGKAKDLTGDFIDPPGGPPNISDAFRINDEDQVIGTATFSSTNAPSWASAFLLDLQQTNIYYLWAGVNPLTGLPSPEALNDAGEMAGAMAVLNPTTYQLVFANAFVGQVDQVTSNQVMNLSNLPGCQSGIALSINALSQSAGVCSQVASALPEFIQPRAVVWQNSQANLQGTGQATDLGTNGYYSRASCINDLGTVVGDSWPVVGSEYIDGPRHPVAKH